ncbi:MAG: hypothetical protein JW809_16445 [Pirellulales bacterium]|nr:hypothetical protein [Pirellulales bacterium]
MRNSPLFAIPRFLEWATAVVAVAWIGLALVILLLSGKATSGFGFLLALTSAVIPVVCLAIPSRRLADKSD